MDIKTRKKQLINDALSKNAAGVSGRKTVGICAITMILLRLALFIFELVFYSMNGLKLDVISNILLLPFIFGVYMIYDGNKGIAPLLSVAAAIRIACYFLSTYDKLGDASLINAYTAIILAVMVLQFAIALLVSYASGAQEYFKLMQSVNMQIQKEYLAKSGRR